MNPLSIGKSIFVCLIKIINYLGYEKNDIHFMHSDRFAFGLLTIRNARQSGGSTSRCGHRRSIRRYCGDRAGGYNGSQFGALLGTVTGAAVGNAITTPREETYQVEEYYVKTYPSSSQYEHTSSYEPSSGLRIINLRFIDDNRNHVIDAEEDSKLVFDVVNDGDVPAYNVTPVIEEMSGMKHILISPSAQIAYMPVGNQIRYTATIRGGRKLKTGQAQFRVFATESNGAVTEAHEFTLPTQKRIKK